MGLEDAGKLVARYERFQAAMNILFRLVAFEEIKGAGDEREATLMHVVLQLISIARL